MLSTSLKATGREFAYPPELIPNPVIWHNYVTVVEAVPFGLWFRNTMVITLSALAGTVITASMAGFALARLRFREREAWLLLVISTMMLPGVVTLIPRFLIFKSLKWMDTYLPLVVPAWCGGGAFNVFLFRQFFASIPPEFDEAARMDGASSFLIFTRIIMPLSRPVLATVAIFSFLDNWNAFMEPLIYISTREKFTLAIGLNAFRGRYSTYYALLMAASAITVVPIIVLFFFTQRYFIQGITITGLAGR
ncbi:MAG: carbohydrate ABC transporter permease [Anaerolineae bacterium]|nr:carbohydrate ABC transporter permease [Anaerolineae bacterium]